MKIAILGAGMVGRAIALDLDKNFEVASFDISEQSLAALAARSQKITTRQANLQDYSAYPEMLKLFDLVVSAVPGFMGYETLRHILLAGKSVVDISFFPENALELDALAKSKNLTAIVDCGVAPGMSNLILGRYNETMDVQAFTCYVGGLPLVRTQPWEYKAPFSPVDVIEEYTRPARLKENGVVVTKPALSEPELLDFTGIGTLEAFNTDGLRSLLFTMPHIPDMKEKTLRYPGHIALVTALKRSGFFDEQPILVKGEPVVPLEFSSQILFRQWKLQPTEPEFTIMKIVVEGERDGQACSVSYDLFDCYDPRSQTSSMARTTGYTCTAAVNLLASGLFFEKGVFPPELVGRHEVCFDFVLAYLKERGVVYERRESGDF